MEMRALLRQPGHGLGPGCKLCERRRKLHALNKELTGHDRQLGVGAGQAAKRSDDDDSLDVPSQAGCSMARSVACAEARRAATASSLNRAPRNFRLAARLNVQNTNGLAVCALHVADKTGRSRRAFGPLLAHLAPLAFGVIGMLDEKSHACQ